MKTSGNVSSQGEEEPPEKLLVISPIPESSYSYTRKQQEFKKMFGKNLKDMKRTKVPAKRKFSEWFPEKKEKWYGVLEDEFSTVEKKEKAFKRLKTVLNVNLRVSKLKRSGSPLHEDEEALQGMDANSFRPPSPPTPPISEDEESPSPVTFSRHVYEEEEDDVPPLPQAPPLLLESTCLSPCSSSPPPPGCLSPLKGTDSADRMEEKFKYLDAAVKETDEYLARMDVQYPGVPSFSSPSPPRCLSPLKGTDSIERMEEKINDLEKAVQETDEYLARMDERYPRVPYEPSVPTAEFSSPDSSIDQIPTAEFSSPSTPPRCGSPLNLQSCSPLKAPVSPLKATDSIDRMEEKIFDLDMCETDEETAEMDKLKKVFDRFKRVTNMHTKLLHRVQLLLQEPLPEDPQAEDVEDTQEEDVEPQVEEFDRFSFAAVGYGPTPEINDRIAKAFAERQQTDEEPEPVIGDVLLEKIVGGDLAPAPCTSEKKKDFYDEGTDYSLAHGRVRDQMIRSDYLILGQDRTYQKVAIHDHGVHVPLDETKHRDEDVRVCSICDNTRIFLGDWPLHIRSSYHQIKCAIKKKLAGCCFLRNKNIRPHLWNECDVCLKMRENVRSNPELLDTSLNDWSVYNPLSDQTYQEHLDRVAIAERATSGFTCEPCGKKNLSKEYFDKHISGKAHKLKMKQIGAERKQLGTSVSNKKRKSDSSVNTSTSKKPRFADRIPDTTWDATESVTDDTSANTSTSKKRDTGRIPDNTWDPSESTSTSSAPAMKVAASSDFDSCIKANDDKSFLCTICDCRIAQKRNVKPHLKSKRHQNNCKTEIASSDEEATGSGNLDELGFARDTTSPRPGCHFLLEFNRPVKYKIARRLLRSVAACTVCLKRFRSLGVLRRHRESKAHREMVKVRIAKRRKMNKKVAGGDITHGEIIAKIYERFPSLKLKFLSKRKILRRKLIKEQQFIDKAVICNEFGGELFKNSHSHMYLQTHDKYTFKKMKKVFKKKFNQKINDIRRPMNFREYCKYCTKEDRAAVVVNVPLKFTSTVYRAARYFQESNSATANYGDYIPSTIAGCDRKIFESVLATEGKLNESICMAERTKSVQLLAWQNELMTELEAVRDSNRKVIWIADIAGGAGKSVLCQWLMSYSQGYGSTILFQDFDYRNNSFLYSKEKMVLFDLPRTSKPDNLKFIEDLKNGYIISTKYEVRKKVFESPVVIVFANSYPEKTLLSIDRWHVFHISRGVGDDDDHLVFHPEYNRLI